MYTLIDLIWIRRYDGLLFNSMSIEYHDYIDYCNDEASPVILLENPLIYEYVMGKHGVKNVAFCKIKEYGMIKRSEYLNANKMRKRGDLISKLCLSVIEYMAGKNDSLNLSTLDVDTFISKYQDILIPLKSNRHMLAKSLIDAIVPDEYISIEDKNNIDDIYDHYIKAIDKV